MLKSLFLFGIFLTPYMARAAEEPCSKINFCQIEKKTYGKKGWVTDYSKEMNLKDLCYLKSDSSHNLQLEPSLGVNLQIFAGKSESSNLLERNPWLLVDLYTYKLTYVVANGKANLDSSGFSFSHRLSPKGKSLIEVTCTQKK